MNSICKMTDCTGCGACVNVCPADCIELSNSCDGFLYPDIDLSKCLDCGLCKKVCPQNKNDVPIKKNAIAEVYKSYSKDYSILKRSTSGGIFSELAFWVLKNNGVVFGAELNENHEVYHSFIEDFSDIYKFNGSKYVGSNVLNTYRTVRDFLKQGRKVLFSGTPCQIDGLKNYLGKEYEDLFTLDFICHGVGSLKILRLYIEYLEKLNHGKISKIKFRDKAKGYVNTSFSVCIQDANGKQKTLRLPSYNSPFGKLFAEGKINRESCSTCKYASTERVSDITVADLVKDLTIKEMKNGCSLVLINTEKGKKLFDAIQNNVVTKKLDLDYAKSVQQHLTKPQTKSELREKILTDVDRMNFDEFILKYCAPDKIPIQNMFVILLKHLKLTIKNNIKKFITRWKNNV